MEEPATLPSPPRSPHASLRIFYLFNQSNTKLELVSFDLSKCSLLLCGSCRNVLDVGAKNLVDAAECVVKHWCMRGKTDDHPPGVSRTEFLEFARPQMPGGAQIIPKQGVLLFESFFDWQPIQVLYGSIPKVPIKICSLCLFQKKRHAACCGAGEEMRVQAYTKSYYAALPVLPDALAMSFYANRYKPQGIVHSIRPSSHQPSTPSHLQLPTSSSSSSSTPSFHPSYTPCPIQWSTPSSSSSALTPATTRNVPVFESSTMSHPTTEEKRARFAIPVAESTSMFAIEGTTLALSVGVNNDFSKAVPFPIDLTSPELCHPLLVPNPGQVLTVRSSAVSALSSMPTSQASSKKDHILLRLFGHVNGYPPLEQQEADAKVSSRINRSDGRDQVLLQACVLFLNVALTISFHTQSDVKSRLNQAIFDPHRLGVGGKRENEPLVILSAGFPVSMSKSVMRGHAELLARFFRVLIERGLPLHLPVRKELQSVLDDPFNSGASPEEWNLRSLPNTIALALFSLLQKEGSSTIQLYLQQFLFQMRSSFSKRRQENDDSLSDDDDDEDDHGLQADGSSSSATAVATGTANEPVLSTVSFLIKVLSTMIQVFKLAALVQYDLLLRRFQVASQFAMTARQPLRMVIPLDEVCDKLAGACTNAVWLAQTMSTLRATVDKSSPSLLNAVTLEKTATNELVIVAGPDQFLGDDFVTCASTLQQETKRCLAQLLLLPAASDDLQAIWRDILDPAIPDLNPLKKHVNGQRGGGEYVILDLDSAGCHRIHRLAKQAIEHSADEFSTNLLTLRDLLLALIQFSSGNVLRGTDLVTLQVASSMTMGTLFPSQTLFGAATLTSLVMVSKTMRDGIAVLAQWVARLAMIFLRILRPLTVGEVMAEFRDKLLRHGETYPDLLSRLSLTEDEVKGLVQTSLTSLLAAEPRLSPKVEIALRQGTSLADLTFETCLFTLGSSRVCETVRRLIGFVGLHSMMTFATLRHVLVVYKTNALSFIQERQSRIAPSQDEEDLFASLMEKRNRIVDKDKSLLASGGIGMHTVETNLHHYQPATVLDAASGTSVSQLKNESASLTEAFIAFHHQTPIPRNGRFEPGRTLVLNGPGQSILNRIQEREKLLRLPSSSSSLSSSAREVAFSSSSSSSMTAASLPSIDGDVDHRLRKALETNLGMHGWTCEAQQKAARWILTTGEGVILLLFPCGTGKTVTFLLPLSMAPFGFSLIVCPYVALMESMFTTATDTLGLRCEKFDSSNLTRFGPKAIGMTRDRDDEVRFIFAVTDTAVSPECMSFLDTAKSQNCLNAIVLDEAHQVLVSQTYRRCMTRVRHFARYAGLLIFASGTTPPCFETSLLGEFGLHRETTVTFRLSDTYQGRLIANLVRYETCRTVDDLHHYVITVLEHRLINVPGDRRSILVFSMTKFCNNALFEVVANTLSGFRAVKMDSESTSDERSEFLSAFDHPRDSTSVVVGFSTSAAAEGVDFRNIGFVLVAGGTFGGLLLLHQMFNRAGRGVSSSYSSSTSSSTSSLPQAMFIYTPHYIDNLLQDIHLRDGKALEPFCTSDRAKVKSFITIKALDNVFRDETACGGLVMEELLNGKSLRQTLQKCGVCRGCRGCDWDYPLPKSNPSRSLVALSSWSRQQSLFCTSTSSSSSSPIPFSRSLANLPYSSHGGSTSTSTTTAPPITMPHYEITDCERRWLSAFHKFMDDLGNKCATCNSTPKNPSADVDNDCWPNFCQMIGFTKSHSQVFCTLCFQGKDQCDGFKRGEHLPPKNESRPEYLARQKKLYEKKNCAVAVKDCEKWEQLRPCVECWLVHETTQCCRRKHLVRSIALAIWWNPDLRQSFLESLSRTADRECIGSTWQGFFRWVVYGSQGRKLNNAYFLLDYFIGMRQLWLKRPRSKNFLKDALNVRV